MDCHTETVDVAFSCQFIRISQDFLGYLLYSEEKDDFISEGNVSTHQCIQDV